MNKRLLIMILTLTSIIFVFSLTSILEPRENYKKYASTSLSDDILAYNNNFESLLKFKIKIQVLHLIKWTFLDLNFRIPDF